MSKIYSNKDEISRSIRKRKDKLVLKEGYLRLVIRIVIVLILAYLILNYLLLIKAAEGMDMFPAIKDGDLVFASRINSEYRKQDIVYYEEEGNLYLGRILAVGGENVAISEEGTFQVNGVLQVGEIVFPTMPGEILDYPIHVEEGSYFILGDYRTQAKDSRVFGLIKEEKIVGKVFTLLRRRGI